MEIAELGKVGLIDRLTKDIQTKNASTVSGLGDDAAVAAYPQTDVLTAHRLLMQGVDFDLIYTAMQELGYKAAMIAMADIFAMNGTPRQLMVSIAVDKRFKVEDLDDFRQGLDSACAKWDVDITGLDVTSSFTGVAVSVTVIGEAAHEDVVYRHGARETDLVCVSGDLGAAYMGLQLLEREKRIYFNGINDIRRQLAEAEKAGNDALVQHLKEEHDRKLRDFQPDFSGREYLVERQLKPEARGDILQLLRENTIRPTAMTVISDGLNSELLHLCRSSECGCRIYEKNIPIDYQTAVQAEEFNMNVTTCAMNGGQDYELLFTVPIGDHDKLDGLERQGIKQIGYITKPVLGARLIARDNQEFDITAQAWTPQRG